MPWTAGFHNFVGDVFSQVTLPWDWQFCLIFNGNSLSLCCQITLGWLLICVFKGLQEMDTVRVQKANGQDLKTLFVTSHMLRHEYFFNVCWLIYNIHVHIMVTRLTFNTYFTPRPRPALRLFFFSYPFLDHSVHNLLCDNHIKLCQTQPVTLIVSQM